MKRKKQATYPAERLDPGKRTGLIFCGMGGPNGLDTVQPFLRNLFSDPAILPVPRLFSPLVGRLMSMRRAPGARGRYQQVNSDGVTPQLATTLAQAQAIAQMLADGGTPCIGAVAMRYWHPFPEETLRDLVSQGAEQFLLVPAYPQYSCATTGSVLKFVLDAMPTAAPGLPVHVIPQWHLLPGLLDVLAQAASAALMSFSHQGLAPETCGLLYVAHSLPLKFVSQGDPYLMQSLETAYAVQDKVKAALAASSEESWAQSVMGMTSPLLSFQSKVGPISWVDPDVTETVEKLAAQGCRHMHIQPISFTCEHIETLLELDVELKEVATDAGVQTFSRGQALNLQSRWLESMTLELQRRSFKPEVLRS